MNIKAIIASLVLGSSSLAMAAPSLTVSADARFGATTQPIARPMPPVYSHPVRGGWYEGTGAGGGWQRPVIQPIVYQAPVTLGSGLTFAGQGRKFITVGAQAGRFGKLEIAASGRTFIQQVYVQFANGQEQVIRNLDRTVTAGQCLTLDLDGDKRAIRRIVVYGSDLNNRGWRRAAGSFSVTAA